MKAGIVNKTTTVWKAIYEDLSRTEEREYASHDIATKTGLNVPTAGRHQRFFRGLGLVSYRSDYTIERGGQHVFMKLEASLDDGLTAIYKHFDAGRSFSYFETAQPGHVPQKHKVRIKPTEDVFAKDERPVIADERSREEVRAIVGPEPVSPMRALAPLRKDEVDALVEAARQYTHRTDAVTQHIEDLRALGVEVDVDLVMKGIKLTTDPELEAIGKVLPYIDRLEKQAVRLIKETGEDRTAITELRRATDVMRKEVNGLRDANKRLSERNVALTGARVVSETVTATT